MAAQKKGSKGIRQMVTHIPIHKGSLMFAAVQYSLLSTELLDHHTVILCVISEVQFPVLQKKGERGHSSWDAWHYSGLFHCEGHL